MVLAVVLITFLFVVGPTVFILNTFTESLGAYLANLIPMSFRTAAFGDAGWLSSGQSSTGRGGSPGRRSYDPGCRGA
jgi:choline-glycine betaine transporter